MRNNNIRLEYRTPRASRSTGALFSSSLQENNLTPVEKTRYETVQDTIFLEFNDEISVMGKGIELVFQLEAKIPVVVPMKLPNHINEEYPIIHLDDSEDAELMLAQGEHT